MAPEVMKRGNKVVKITKDELCASCRQIRWRMNNGDLSPMTIEEFLDASFLNATPEGQFLANRAVLVYLESDGGCARCINLFK